MNWDNNASGKILVQNWADGFRRHDCKARAVHSTFVQFFAMHKPMIATANPTCNILGTGPNASVFINQNQLLTPAIPCLDMV
jgi:hypothetical protein